MGGHDRVDDDMYDLRNVLIVALDDNSIVKDMTDVFDVRTSI